MLDTWGLATPHATLSIRLSGQGSIGRSISFGDDAGPDSVYALVRGQNIVFTLRNADRDRLLASLYTTAAETPALAEPDPSTPPREPGN